MGRLALVVLLILFSAGVSPASPGFSHPPKSEQAIEANSLPPGIYLFIYPNGDDWPSVLRRACGTDGGGKVYRVAFVLYAFNDKYWNPVLVEVDAHEVEYRNSMKGNPPFRTAYLEILLVGGRIKITFWHPEGEKVEESFSIYRDIGRKLCK